MFKAKDSKNQLIIQTLLLITVIIILNLLKIEKKGIVITGLFIIIANVIHYIYQYRENKKIIQLSIYMNNILNDNYSLDIRDYEEGILSNLKNDIYKMTIKLKEQSELSKKDQKYLETVLSDISHQLKTPLTSMYVINDILISDDKMKPETKKEFLIKNKTQLERIEWLVTTLLKMSRLESGSEKLIIQKVKIKDLITKTISPLQIPIELKNQKLVLDYDENIELNIDLNWTAEGLINILKNAHEHTKENGTIKIEVNNTPIYTGIKIIDTGDGIDKEDLPHIFERFYKGKSNKESIGIGLNMAKKIFNYENGDVTATSSFKGTTFDIKFYKNNL